MVEFLHHWPMIQRFALHYTPSWVDPEDACQDAALWCLSHWHDYDPNRGSVSTWAYHRVREQTRRYHHAQWRHRNAVRLDAPAYVGDSDEPTLLELVPANSPDWTDRAAVRIALQALPPNLRLVLYLKYWLGWQQIEIAPYLGVSQPHVHRLEKSALNKLRKLLIA